MFVRTFIYTLVLGKGYGEPIAYEGALKLKEIGYIHAEGASGGALKHGPFALIEGLYIFTNMDNCSYVSVSHIGESGKFGATPVICIILDDEHAALMRTVAEEVCAYIHIYTRWYILCVYIVYVCDVVNIII